ncbi:MAG: toprim domain-containing protein, partial [bacterium]|nr:toprim domain-containing protein [bacterium]
KLLGSPQGEEATTYIEKRGLTAATLEKWGIGFAPDSFDTLLKALQSKQVKAEEALQAGVLAKSEKGKVFDRFRNRVMFPIHNYYGDVVGFTARTLSNEDGAKYLNSPETPIYNKSKILFGLFFGREAIRKADEVVIVEGQMDAIAAHQADFENTVATSGTALTEDHLRLLGRLTKNLKFCFDADKAGLAALRRAGELALPMGFRIKVIKLEGVKDPDELIQKSPGLWRKAVAEGYWFIDYYLDVAQEQFEYGSLEQKRYVGEEVAPLLKYSNDPLEQDHYVRVISERFGVSESAVRAIIQPPKQSVQSIQTKTESPMPVTQETVQEKEILGGLLLYPEFRDFIQEEGLPTEFISPSFQAMINAAILGETTFSSQETPLANEAIFMVESSLENLSNNELALMRELKKSFYLFKLAGIKRMLQDTTTAIKKAEVLQDTEGVAKFNQLFAQISSERYNLEKKIEG